jgi:hypothetical protein
VNDRIRAHIGDQRLCRRLLAQISLCPTHGDRIGSPSRERCDHVLPKEAATTGDQYALIRPHG